MQLPRFLIGDFNCENPAYAGSAVSVYAVDDDDERTAELVPLYAEPFGKTRLANPQKLTSRGAWAQPVYVATAFAMRVMPHVGQIVSFEDEEE